MRTSTPSCTTLLGFVTVSDLVWMHPKTNRVPLLICFFLMPFVSSEEIAFYNGNMREKQTIYATFKKLVGNKWLNSMTYRLEICIWIVLQKWLHWSFWFWFWFWILLHSRYSCVHIFTENIFCRIGGPFAQLYLLSLLNGICGQHNCQM